MHALTFGFYDIIFFRNAFIYFLPDARKKILTNLADALQSSGLLVMGVSETAGVRHEKLKSCVQGDMFYFKKTDTRLANPVRSIK
jgi:chemotaxis methyl-accepting protein methylase